MMRFERKFQVDGIPRDEIDLLVKTLPALFFEEHASRFVNNIYFDTHNLDHYNDALAGACDRIKVRIRWYGQGQDHLSQPVLELKAKQGQVGTKSSFPLHEMVLDEFFSQERISNVIGRAGLPPHVRTILSNLRPVLINRYQRTYMVSADRCVRLTIDSDLEYWPIDQPLASRRTRKADPTMTVIELKYDSDLDMTPSTITNRFPFRMTKCSKYVHGMDLLAA